MGIMQLNGANSPARRQSRCVAGIALSLRTPWTYTMLLRARYPSCLSVFWIPGKCGGQLFILLSMTLSHSFGFLFGVLSTLPRTLRGQGLITPGIQLILDAWPGDVNSNRSKLTTAEHNWTDAVFGDLIREWSGIFGRARNETRQLMRHLPTIPLDR